MNNRKKILVIDLDDCTVTSHTDDASLLSEKLVEFAKSGNYDGFYACTHRSRPALRNIKIKLNEYSKIRDIVPENLFTSNIIQNFSNATGLNCLAVSTPNDAVTDQCGSGYHNIILPFENAVLHSGENIQDKINDENFKLDIAYTQLPVERFDTTTKNPQLKQIASHATKIFPESEIILDYVDDNIDLCKSAATITSLPDGLIIHCYQHKAAEDRNKISHIATDSKENDIVLDFKIDENQVHQLLKDRCGAQPIVPELVKPEDVRKPEAYNRFQDLETKENFRMMMLESLQNTFSNSYGYAKTSQLISEFKALAQSLEDQGAVIFGSMINTDNFMKLISMYSQKLSTDGSQSWIHSYINLGNHPDFLSDNSFNGAFVHPLLIALISYGAGGPIRMVDARGKDAEPLAVQAQDNMLHIDNTPFRKEYKVILTWERGKASGPKGQNFVFIPGTHKGVRNCHVSESNQAWSTEDGSIFISNDAVQSVFDMQEKVLGQSPLVVEASHPTMPLTTVFEAGALVHHRYRTKEKNVPRSCVIVAFHRAQDNPGQFLANDHLNNIAMTGSLQHLLMGKHSDNTEIKFINSVLSNAELIANKISEFSPDNTAGAKIVEFSTRKLQPEELNTWKSTVTSAPTVEAIKIEKDFFHIGDSLTHTLLTEMMKYDKHGPLDLILFGDGHEEIRKWARNRIREMPITRLENRLEKIIEWDLLSSPALNNVLTPEQLKITTGNLLQLIDNLSPETKDKAHLDPQEKISSRSAYQSIRQLIDDLGEAIGRCTSRQAFLSTSLFIFWACDELSRLLAGPNEKPNVDLMNMSRQLLSHYVSTYVLIEKQILLEKQPQQEMLVSDSLSKSRNAHASVNIYCTHFAQPQQTKINNTNKVEITYNSDATNRI